MVSGEYCCRICSLRWTEESKRNEKKTTEMKSVTDADAAVRYTECMRDRWKGDSVCRVCVVLRQRNAINPDYLSAKFSLCRFFPSSSSSVFCFLVQFARTTCNIHAIWQYMRHSCNFHSLFGSRYSRQRLDSTHILLISDEIMQFAAPN